jgi:hypothetical protein
VEVIVENVLKDNLYCILIDRDNVVESFAITLQFTYLELENERPREENRI